MRPLVPVSEAYVYVIGAPTGFQKIGMSICPKNRLKTLQGKFGADLILHSTHEVPIEQVFHVERFAHHIARAARRQGEWFDLEPWVAEQAVSLAKEQVLGGQFPPSQRTEGRINVIASEALLARIDEWRAGQRPIPNKSEAARMLIERALILEERPRSKR